MKGCPSRIDFSRTLRYVEEATVNKRVSDESYAELVKRFNEEEICEITLVNAIENFYNMVNIPLEIESDSLCAIALERQKPKSIAQATL